MKLPLFVLGIAIFAVSNATASGYAELVPQGVTNGISMAGDKVYGFLDRAGEGSQSTWIFDTNTLSYSQFTSYKENDLNQGGQVMCINSAGTCAGSLRDSEWISPEATDPNSGESIYHCPLYTACIWKDGALIKLDHNKWEDATEFHGSEGELPSSSNGFVAKTIAEDEQAVAGYLKAFTYMLPVRWTKDENGEYKSTMLPRKKGIFYYTWIGASADCSRIIMNTAQVGGDSYIWNGDEEPVIFTYSEAGVKITEPCLTALSPNGRYAIMRCERDGITAFGVFDFETEELRWIPRPEGDTSCNWFAANVITDHGDGFIVNYDYHLHYFNLDLGINIPFDAYLSAYGSEIDYDSTAESILKSVARSVSGDGKIIVGNTLQNALEQHGWIVCLPDTQPMLFNLKDFSVFFSSPDQMVVKWREPSLPEGAFMKKYVLKANMDIMEFEEVEKDTDGMCRVKIPKKLGYYNIRFYGVAVDKDGKEWESVKEELYIDESPDTSLYFFEDLLDSEIDMQAMMYVYSHDTFTAVPPTDNYTLGFRLDGGDFCNPTPFWYTCAFGNAPWHTYLESRWFDATDDNDFYLTWQERHMMVNYATTMTNSNALIVEYTLDGENWIPIHQSGGADNHAKWCARYVNLSMLNGKVFKLRFHATGEGTTACEWRIDYYGIVSDNEVYESPQGLMSIKNSDDTINLAWKNNRGEYEVSYNYNSPMTYNKNLGNGGEPFYVACDYGNEKLAGFEGKYITAVATMLYEPTSTVVQEYHTTVEAVIFDEEGNILSSGKLSDDAPWYIDGDAPVMPIHHITLDTPVQIEKNRTYRVSIKISDYEDEMCPIWYFSASDDNIPGITDLYSDNNLKSWNTISNFYRYYDEETYDEYGRCIFNIRPCITDTPETSNEEYDQLQWFYQVYRDGILLPQGIAFYTQQSAIDTPEGEVAYTVQAFRRDGAHSEISTPMNYSSTGITDAMADTKELTIIKTEDGWKVEGDFDSVYIYTISGIQIASSAFIPNNLAHGVYVIMAIKDGTKATYRILL